MCHVVLQEVKKKYDLQGVAKQTKRRKKRLQKMLKKAKQVESAKQNKVSVNFAAIDLLHDPQGKCRFRNF